VVLDRGSLSRKSSHEVSRSIAADAKQNNIFFVLMLMLC
jgi:hypothetical protein